MTRTRLPYLLIPLVALLAVLPLLLQGCSCGHDLNFHLLNWQEAAQQFAHGHLHPRWAITPAFGAGEPRFVFYPPLSWTLGGVLTLVVTALAPLVHAQPDRLFALTPAIYSWIALTLAGLAMLRLARRFLGDSAATLAAVLYLVNPYTLFTAYERSAFAELLAASLLPLLLDALLPLFADLQRPLSIPAVALPLALLWLANAPAAVIGSYALATLVFLRLIIGRRSKVSQSSPLSLGLRGSLGAVLGLALAAFYIVPAVHERRWVQIFMAVTTELRPDDNTFLRHTADAAHDQVLHTASMLALLLLGASALAGLLEYLRHRHTRLNALLLGLTLLIAFLLTPASLPVWHTVPQLAFLQFPWRLLALSAPVCVLLLGSTVRHMHLRALPLFLLALILAGALILPAYRAFHQSCELEDTPAVRFALFHRSAGSEPTDEYTPVNADNDKLQETNPPLRILPSGASDDLPSSSLTPESSAPHELTLTLQAPARVVLNLRDYPGWQVLVNGHPDTDRIARNDGLLTLPLAAGISHIQIIWHTSSIEIAADLISLLSLCALLRLLYIKPIGLSL